jgi:TolB-like protein
MDVAQDPAAAGREQKVDFVISANYQLANGKIRVTSQLINVSTGRIENTFQSEEVDVSNVFTMQDKLAVSIGKEIMYHPVFAPDSPMEAIGTINRNSIHPEHFKVRNAK